MADEIKKGYVHKCGKSVKSWKRRWFVLKQNGYLYYYTDSSAATEKGKIDVVEATSIVPWSEKVKGAEKPPASLSKDNAFCIVVQDRVFTCVCEMEGESKSWMNALDKVRGASTSDQQYPEPTYPKEQPKVGNAPPPPVATPPAASPVAPPPYTPQALPPYTQGPPVPQPQAPPRGPPMPQPPPSQPPPQPRPPSYVGAPPAGGAGYAGTQAYARGYYQPQPRPPPTQYTAPPQQYPPRPPQAYPPQAYPPRPPQAYPPQAYPPRPPQAYPPQAYPQRPPQAFPQYTAPPRAPYVQPYPPRPAPAAPYQSRVSNIQTTSVTVVNIPAPQQRVIVRR